jgi:hypothetical protein
MFVDFQFRGAATACRAVLSTQDESKLPDIFASLIDDAASLYPAIDCYEFFKSSPYLEVSEEVATKVRSAMRKKLVKRLESFKSCLPGVMLLGAVCNKRDLTRIGSKRCCCMRNHVSAGTVFHVLRTRMIKGEDADIGVIHKPRRIRIKNTAREGWLVVHAERQQQPQEAA